MFDGVHNSYTVVLAAVTRGSPSSSASIPDSGPSTMSTAATQLLSSPHSSRTPAKSLGAGFEAQPGEPHVAIYPGPAASLTQFRRLVDDKPELIPVREFARWSESAAFPQLPSREAFRVWRRMKLHPRFDGSDIAATPPPAGLAQPANSGRPQRDQRQATTPARRWRSRPHRELDATNDKRLFIADAGASARSQNSTHATTSTVSTSTRASQP